MPGIESSSHRRSDDSDDLRTAERLGQLYQSALATTNRYIPLKLGPGKARLAGMLLNHIFADEVLLPANPGELAAVRQFAIAGHLLADRTKQLLEAFPVLRRALISTLWVKRFVDLAQGRNALVAALDRSWAFSAYSSDYPLPTVKEYEIIVRDFDEQLGVELGDYISHLHEAPPTASVASGRDPLLADLALYGQVLHNALEHEAYPENRMHHLGHLAMAARIFTHLHLSQSGISLKRIYHIESCSHAGKLPGEAAESVREAWARFKPILAEYIDSVDHDSA
jgi:hypothetical protein